MRTYRIDVFLTAREAPNGKGGYYESVHEFELRAVNTLAALEQVFDLTNHPSERDPLYMHRSVSVGDHLVVDGRDHYVCCNEGWRIVPKLPQKALTLQERMRL